MREESAAPVDLNERRTKELAGVARKDGGERARERSQLHGRGAASRREGGWSVEPKLVFPHSDSKC
jgi:hypothetical protein